MILLTGATGFVGQNLLRALKERGQKVRCLVRDERRAAGLRSESTELVTGDVTDPESVLAAMKRRTEDSGDQPSNQPSNQPSDRPGNQPSNRIDTVIHLVGILTETRDATFKALHTEATRNVVEACRASGVSRYIHMSALGTRENAASRYHQSKWEAEEIVSSSGLNYSIIRPSVIFGKEDKFTNLFAAMMNSFPVMIVPGNGQNLMQPVSVSDVVAFILFLLKDEKTGSEIYELGGPESFTFDRILDLIARVTEQKSIKFHLPRVLVGGLSNLISTVKVPPITSDQLIMLGEDNVTESNALVDVAGINPLPFEQTMLSYL